MAEEKDKLIKSRCPHCRDYLGPVDITQMCTCEVCHRPVCVTCHRKCRKEYGPARLESGSGRPDWR